MSIPYYSQNINPNNFKSDGFSSKEEATYWSTRACGIACVQMVLKHFGVEPLPLPPLILKCAHADGYKKPIGWIHQSLADLITEQGITAECKKLESFDELINLLDNKAIIIASTTLHFKGGYSKPDGSLYSKGGHLVIVHGYKQDKNNQITHLIIHDPHDKTPYHPQNYQVPINEFQNSWSGLTIVAKA
jgi:hypothetical protein